MNRLHSHVSDNWKGVVPSDYGSDFNPEPPIFSAKFCNVAGYRHILAIANEDGKVAIQDTDKRNEDPGADSEIALDGHQCHYNAVFDLEWMPNSMKFVSASGDHSARLWDFTESKIVLNRIFMGHTRSVKTATFRRNDSSVFATGGRDGAILIWDTRATVNQELMPKADNCIFSGHLGGTGTPQSSKKKSRVAVKLASHVASSSITGLGFQDDNTLVSCGAGDGVIKVWDLRRNYSCFKREPQPKFSFPYPGSSTFKGFTNLLIDGAGIRMYVNCMDSNIYCYNLSSYSTKPIQRYTGHKNSTFYIKSALSPDGLYLISGSSDERAYIWNVENPKPIVALTGHTVEVTCAAWSSTNDVRIVTCSDDARHKLWRIGPESIDADELLAYRGRPEAVMTGAEQQCSKKYRMKHLECTPRSIRRLIEENEKTPTTAEKVSNKRTFSEMSKADGTLNHEEDDEEDGNFIKRPNVETRGRRLFSPITSTSSSKALATILEEMNYDPQHSITNNSTTPIRNRLVSPLTEKINYRYSPNLPSTSSGAVYSSPTSNLPNYVLDGEAPHLRITSPKRKLKENVDWLTKIRKQKLLSSVMSTKCLLITTERKQHNTDETDHHNHQHHQQSDATTLVGMSPRVQSLKAECESSRQSTTKTPKRRTSRSGSNSEMRSPSAISRRSSTESILRFFTVTTTNSVTQQQQQTSPSSSIACSDTV